MQKMELIDSLDRDFFYIQQLKHSILALGFMRRQGCPATPLLETLIQKKEKFLQ